LLQKHLKNGQGLLTWLLWWYKMKPTKVRNQQIYRAPYAVKSKQSGSNLSKEIRKKYGRRSVRVVIGDSVKVIRGEYNGIDGKVTKVSIMKNSVAIEGIKREKLKGEKIDVYIPASNILVTGLNTDDHWRKTTLEGKKPKLTPKEAAGNLDALVLSLCTITISKIFAPELSAHLIWAPTGKTLVIYGINSSTPFVFPRLLPCDIIS